MRKRRVAARLAGEVRGPMSMSIPDFWKLVIESHLLTGQQCQQLGASFGNVKGAAGQASARTLAEWLVSEGALSRYQASVLLSGRAGPFFYGEYRVYDRLERGRFQGQFRAVHVPTGFPVRLQFLTGAAVQDPQAWATLAAVVQHRFAHPAPHLVRYFDLVDTGLYKFLAAEDLAGDTLAARLATAGRLSSVDACSVFRDAALGLSHLHQLGLVHGDLRPRDVWVSEQQTVKLLHDPAAPVLPLAAFAGEPAEEFAARADGAAPELAHPQRLPDPLTDLYALGCAFYQALTGSPPFPGGSAAEKLQRHAVEPIQPLEPFGAPQAVAQLVAYLMAKNPGMRYPQAQIVADQLAPFCDPARLHLGPASDPPTLPAYEAYLRQRWAAGLPYAPTHPAPAPVAPTPPTGTAVSPAAGTAATPAGRAVAGNGASSSASTGGAKSAAPTSTPAASAKNRSVGGATGSADRPGARREATAPPVGSPQPPAATAGAARPAAAPGASPAFAPPVAPAASAADRLRDGRRPNDRQKLILGASLGVAGVLLIIGLLVVANSGRPEPTPDPDLAAGSGATTETPDAQASDGSTGGSTAPPKTKPVGETAGGAGKPSGQTGQTGGSGPTKPPGGETSTAGPTEPPKPGPAVEQTVVPDDGALLWASPTSGPPVELDLVPLDSHFLLHLRPAAMLATEEGPRALQGCGPALQNLIGPWEQAAGFPLAEIDRLLFTLHDNGDAAPRPAVVVVLTEPKTAEELTAKWGGPAPTEVKDGTIYQGTGWSYYISPKQPGAFLMGSTDDVKQVAEQRGAPPPLRRELGVLRRLTDADRHVSLLATPNFLTTNLLRDGRTYYFGEARRLREPLDWFLRDEIQAVAFSLHFTEDSYLELRMIGSQGKDKFTLAKEVRDRLQETPDLLFEYIATLGSNPYWERVRLRYPNMINYLHSKTRIGADAETAMLNSRLPRAAVHNLTFATEMVLVSTPGAAAVASTGGAASGKPAASTMTFEDVIYKHKMSMSFEAQSLEFAIQDIAKDVNETLKGLPFEFKIKILGDDLQLDGITRNQTVRDFMHKDKTTAEILTAMVMKANAPAVPDPSMPEQKLLWVIDKDPDDPTKPIVLVTTRAASEKKKYSLPQTFRPK